MNHGLCQVDLILINHLIESQTCKNSNVISSVLGWVGKMTNLQYLGQQGFLVSKMNWIVQDFNSYYNLAVQLNSTRVQVIVHVFKKVIFSMK